MSPAIDPASGTGVCPPVATSESEGSVARVASESIVIVDLVDSTNIITRFGFVAVGQHILRDLRRCIQRVGSKHGLRCRKFTGDGYMLAFSDPNDAANTVTQALRAIVGICHAIEELNKDNPKERKIRLRFALHFGEVYVVDNDREGPEVSYAFRLEAIGPRSLQDEEIKGLSMDPSAFPADNYVVLSQVAVQILEERKSGYSCEMIAILPLKGFTGLQVVSLIRELSQLSCPNE